MINDVVFEAGLIIHVIFYKTERSLNDWRTDMISKSNRFFFCT